MISLEELREIRKKKQGHVGVRNDKDTRVLVGMATCGIAAGARPVFYALKDEIRKEQLKDIQIFQTGCIGLCQYEPIVEVIQPGKEKVTYVHMDAEKARVVVDQHFKLGKPVAEYMLK